MRKKLDDILERGKSYVCISDYTETTKGCLLIYSDDEYQRILKEFGEKIPASEQKGRSFRRFYFASAYHICYEGKLVPPARVRDMMGYEEAEEYEVIIDENGAGSSFARLFSNYLYCITDFIPIK